ncbi:MAG: hypothetical protein KDJ20_04165 [Hyphomicrobiales bacterium]|nr:hypothetical protein [Rhodoblastus sp.]MCC2101443.1 hypothetical protein [Hyphomicrobiales bacterium]MCC2103281.1 hypothetical protein [Hyphomicrobiales bacterium]
MEPSQHKDSLTRFDLLFFRSLFLVAALWNFAGALPGLTDASAMFSREFGRELADPVMVAVYRGAWGTAFLYGFGFLIVAHDLLRHTGIVLMGGAGKALFALNLCYMYRSGWTSDFAIIVILGDVVFVGLFALYFMKVKRLGVSIL